MRRAVARSLSWDEVSLALAAHPRIGDRVEGSSSEAQASRREQSPAWAIALAMVFWFNVAT